MRKTSDGWKCDARDIAREKYIVFPIARGYEFEPVISTHRSLVRNFVCVGSNMYTSRENKSIERYSASDWNEHQLLNQNANLMNLGTHLFRFGKKNQEIFNVVQEIRQETRKWQGLYENLQERMEDVQKCEFRTREERDRIMEERDQYKEENIQLKCRLECFTK